MSLPSLTGGLCYVGQESIDTAANSGQDLLTIPGVITDQMSLGNPRTYSVSATIAWF